MTFVVRAGAIAAALLCSAVSASAQQVPMGSYLKTCHNSRLSGSTLVSYCADPSGQFRPTSLAIGSCKGDIANTNGALTCSGANAAPAAAPSPAAATPATGAHPTTGNTPTQGSSRTRP